MRSRRFRRAVVVGVLIIAGLAVAGTGLMALAVVLLFGTPSPNPMESLSVDLSAPDADATLKAAILEATRDVDPGRKIARLEEAGFDCGPPSEAARRCVYKDSPSFPVERIAVVLVSASGEIGPVSVRIVQP